MGEFNKSDMLYKDGNYYKWNAKADQDNPYYTGGTDYLELNRTEGYEVLYFINHIGNKLKGETPSKNTYQKIEKMICHYVPSNIRTHAKIENWIIDNWSNY